MREARLRRDLIAGELAAGRNPADLLRAMVDQPARRLVADWASAYQESRVDVAGGTVKNMVSRGDAAG